MRALFSCLIMIAVAGVGSATALAASGPKAGVYTCRADSAGQFQLEILNAMWYATRYPGQPAKGGKFTTDGARLTFTTGPLKGFYGGVLSREIGLTSRANNTSYSTVCSPG